ncbi:MAG: helix-turn-helix transcriptional regulator [Spirochaetes bacterium]|nr:helix-turn-helix transcriptional regulator [Spirochaetota bacterium]
MKEILLIVVSLQVLAAALPARADDALPGRRIDLSGRWKITLEDRKDFAGKDFDDSSWDAIDLPGSFMSYARKLGRQSGTAWVRKTFRIGEGSGRPSLGLILGRIGNADETYFNGSKIGGLGRFPPGAHSSWNHPRNYLVPSGLINYGGDNTVAVRISYWYYGDVVGALALADLDAWSRDRTWRYFFYIINPFLIISIALLLLIIFLSFYIARPSEQEYLFYSLQILFGFFIVYDLCAFWNIYPSLFFRFQTIGFSWVGINVVHIIFLHRIYDLERKRIEIFLWTFLALWTVGVFFLAESDPFTYGIALIASCTSLGIYHLACHFYALYRRRPYAGIFGLFAVEVVCCSMHDSFVYVSKITGYPISLFGHDFTSMLFPYGAFLLFTGTALVLVFRFLALRDEVDGLNQTMERYIIENALLQREKEEAGAKRKPGYRRVISPETEEKIERIIGYINENYSESLSREGLAASVDLHPDNLSKLFNAHKKMRIGDYINGLRVREAASLLVSSDRSVIEIAFAVGFESLRTFNRAFAREIKTTPEQYRKNPPASPQ